MRYNYRLKFSTNKIKLVFTIMLSLIFLIGCSAMKKDETVAANKIQSTPVVFDGTSTIKWNSLQQNIDGFGGSEAFGKAANIMNLKEPVRTQILDLIFSKEKGIGVSILRNIIGDANNSNYIIEPEKGKFVWEDANWETKKANFDKEQIWLMNEAKKRGVTTFMSTAWSPPSWMKTNNAYEGLKTGKLKTECYQDYADYLAEYVLGYKKYFDIDISYISPANEPTIAPEYAGCLWTGEEYNIFVRDYLGPTFKAKDVKAKIMMPEHMNFTESLAVPALNDPVTLQYIDVVATHAYGIGNTVPALPVSNGKGKTIWQTEYMNQGEKLQTFKNNTMQDALRYGNLIGNMFSVPRVNAYFWWWLAASNLADGSDLIRLSTIGTNNSTSVTGQYRIFKRFYAFGNYSRFIRPGFVMIDSDKKPTNNTFITACKDPKTNNFAIVAINNSNKPQTINFKLSDFSGSLDSVVPYRTSPNENMKKLQNIKVINNSFTMELKPSSITTFIPKDFELNALPDIKDVYSTYEAEENDGQTKGLKIEDCTDGGKMITNIKKGNYIKYSNVNFADGTANGVEGKTAILSMNARINSINGGIIELKLDDPVNGKVVGTITVPKSDDEKHEKWTTASAMINTKQGEGANGIHDLYIVFNGDKDKEMFNVNYFEFSDGIEK